MFANAVQQHENVSHLKAQQWPKSQSSNPDPLKSTSQSVLNSSHSHWPSSHNPLKRTASQVSSMEGEIVSQEELRKKPVIKDAFSGKGPVSNLHVNIFFDENDFDDDKNIDLDDDPQQVKETGLSVQQFRHVPSGTNTATTPETLASSMPLPWSSSPLQHHQLPPPKLALDDVRPAKAVKRGKLPWQGEEANQDLNTDLDRNSVRGPPEFVIKKMLSARNNKVHQIAEPKTETPGGKTDSPYPWKVTASAVKEEQRRLRQRQKRNVKDYDASVTQDQPRKKIEVLPQVFLSDEQRSVLEMVVGKEKSVFFTGSAGTGKSVLMREIIRKLRAKYRREPDRVAVTASTGLAACNVGGVTLHSFAGIGLGKEPAPELVRKIKRNQKAKNRWLRTKILIVDEISMVDGELFDKLEEIARSIRNNGRPFGGIQLVITGDFFQLPPVPDSGRVSKFSFDASTWNTSIDHTIGLTQVFRQKDPVFASMLNEMRLGKLTPKSINAFRQLNRPLGFKDDFEATELFPTRFEVDNANRERMRNLGGFEKEFKAVDGGSISDFNQRDKLLANCMAPPSITLKKGAQVMLIKNIDDTLVNGSVGKVVAFMDEATFDIYHEDEDGFQAMEDYDPDDQDIPQSRLKLRQMLNKSSDKASNSWPLVRFSLSDGNTRDLLCQHEVWKIELPNGEVQASRSQIPLILAWALSIHKAQGQTLERVKVDLGKIFEKGQAYVALSRATSQEGLQIMRFDPKKVMAHERVRTFYDGLYSVQQAIGSGANSTTINASATASVSAGAM